MSKDMQTWKPSSRSPVIGFRKVNACRACGGALASVYNLGVQDVVNFGDKPLVKAPLELMVCKECFLPQLHHEVDRSYLFETYYFRSNSNATYVNHLKEVAYDVLRRAKPKKGDVIVDIGANDGTWLSFIPNKYVTFGFEPAKNLGNDPDEQAWLIQDFFPAGITIMDGAKVIYCGFMFYDISDPLAFLKEVKKMLAKDGLFVVQMNYLPMMLKNNAVDNISAEHQTYWTLRSLQNLLFRAGLQAEDVSFNDINGGSFRVYIRHRSNRKPSETVSGILAGEKRFESLEPYQDFAKRVKEEMHKLHAIVALAVAKDHQTVDIVGSSTRGLTIVQQAGLDKTLIRCAVERNPAKVGKTYAGIPIISEEQAKASPADIYLILIHNFKDEVIARMTWGKKFLLPLPTVKVITP